MRYLILSDLHGNLEALKTTLAQAPDHDKLVCLGDLVGYGASPNEVIQVIRQLHPAGIIRGNHDKVCSGLESGDNFNSNAYQSAIWTKNKLTKRNIEYLRGLPAGPLQVDERITIAHGSPMDEDYYILYEHDAYLSFRCFDTIFCFFGHTHVPGIFILEEERSSFYYFIPRGKFELKLDLSGGTRYLINPGSIGQPRDYDPRASFCLLDTRRETLLFNKIGYPVETASQKISVSGLPEFLGERLFTGV